MKLSRVCLLTVLAASAFQAKVIANEVFESKEDAMGYRQAAFSMLHMHFDLMGDMVKGKRSYDPEEFVKRAEHVAALSRLPWEAFIKGSDKGETSALPAIWEKQADFMSKAKSFEQSTAHLANIAQSDDKAKIKTAFKSVAKECKACHNKYKD